MHCSLGTKKPKKEGRIRVRSGITFTHKVLNRNDLISVALGESRYLFTSGLLIGSVCRIYIVMMMLSIQSAHFSCLLALLTFPWSIISSQHPLELHPTSKSPLLSLHRALVEIESISGNEYEVGEFLHSYLTAHNFTVERQHVDPLTVNAETSRFNLLAYSGDKHSARVLLSSHIDTVPPYWPYETRKNNQIWGRGSVDAKGCVATQIQAVQELLAADEIAETDVALLFVVGEEIGGDGMRKANNLGLS